jgi:hypothetical protein
MAISKKSWLGVATEASPGTARTTPTLYHPCKSKFSNKTKYVYLDEERGTRDGNYGRVPTVQHATGSITGPYYNDTSPYFLYGFMGADTASQPNAGTDPTVWQHALSCADIPPALDLFRGYDAAQYNFVYTAVDKVTFKYTADGKLLEMDADVQSQYGTKNATVGTPTFSGLLPFAGYLPTIQIGGVASSDVEEMTITLQQKITLFYPAAGSQQFVVIYYGERKADISFTARFDSDTPLYNHFFNGSGSTPDHVNVDFKGPVISGIYNEELILDFPIVGWDEMDLDTSKDNVQIKGKGTPMPGTTPNSLFTATVTNTVTSYTM